jgi:hypothetical protein
MVYDAKKHRNIWPILIGVAGILMIVIERNLLVGFTLTYLGAGAVIAAAGWNLILRKRAMTSFPPRSVSP